LSTAGCRKPHPTPRMHAFLISQTPLKYRLLPARHVAFGCCISLDTRPHAAKATSFYERCSSGVSANQPQLHLPTYHSMSTQLRRTHRFASLSLSNSATAPTSQRIQGLVLRSLVAHLQQNPLKSPAQPMIMGRLPTRLASRLMNRGPCHTISLYGMLLAHLFASRFPVHPGWPSLPPRATPSVKQGYNPGTQPHSLAQKRTSS
jgi:hypothetical protein